VEALPKADATRLLNRLEQIAAAPAIQHPNVTAMVGQQGVFRVRQGDWRAVFLVEDGDVVVIEIGHRREIYR
jgi:mRNA interferase RelE/StbE